MFKYVHAFLCTILFCIALKGQSQQFSFSQTELSLQELINRVESNSKFYFSFNSKHIDLDQRLTMSRAKLSLDDILNVLKHEYAIESKLNQKSKKIILTPFGGYIIYGIVRDVSSKETISDVLIYDELNLVEAESNNEGYFKIQLSPAAKAIYLAPINHMPFRYELDVNNLENVIVEIEYSNWLPDIIVTPISETSAEEDFQKKDLREIQNTLGISGTSDLLQYLRTEKGVSVGNEGQNGYNVRGGSFDQNLILLDGMPLYEASHLGGLSSVFITDAIKDVDFYKNAFPANYGGKLSSVLDIRLKDGNRNRLQKSFSMGLEGTSASLDGPLGRNTSFSINGKASWFSALVTPLLQESLDFNEVRLFYADIYAKVSHWFSPSNRLSFSAYTGKDVIFLQQEVSDENDFSYTDLNNIEWGNQLYSLQWNVAISSSIYMNAKVGGTNYFNNSLGSYKYSFMDDGEEGVSSNSIKSDSKLNDFIVSNDFDFYTKSFGKIKIGASYTQHQNSPSIKEETVFVGGIEAPDNLDSTYRTRDLAIYIQNKYKISSVLELNSGLRLNTYLGDDSNYFVFQPRLDLRYTRKHFSASVNYSRMSQFIHLLANAGPGIPSDLWVPTTSLVPPEISNNYSLDINYSKNNWSLSSSIFYNKYQNLIEYSNPFDILHSLVLNNSLWGVSVDTSSWESRVTLGEGESYGIELGGKLSEDKFDINFSYTFSQTKRTFTFRNEGPTTFPFKYERPHNLHTAFTYKFNKNKRLKIAWSYGSGYRYTFSDQIEMNPFVGCIIQPDERNNAKVSDFHHLDINYTINKELNSGAIIQYAFGIYNIYNRKNAFYRYFREIEVDDCSPSPPVAEQISIYPILPQINIKYNW